MLAGCGGRADKSATAPAGAGTDSVASLPLPSVPDSLTVPADRAAYVVAHFWDAMDFTDTRLTGDTLFMEQSFSNFISVLPLVSDSDRTAGVDRLLDAAAAASDSTYSYVASVARHYLYDPESPFYDETLYLPFVQYALRRSGGTDLAALGTLDDIAMNAPGKHAPDFSFETPAGTRSSLIKGGSRARILLMFYEPDCERCHASIGLMSASPDLESLIAARRLRVVAVFAGDDRELWRSNIDAMPASWEISLEPDGVIDNGDRYLVRATPSFYLLEPDGTVILKDAPLDVVARYLNI